MSTTIAGERETLRHDLQVSAARLLEGAQTRERLLRDAPGEPFPDPAWRTITEAGWPLTVLPERLGGLGLGLAELGAIFKAVGRRPCRGPLLTHLTAIPLLVESGADEATAPLRDALNGVGLAIWAEAPSEPYGQGLKAAVFEQGVVGGRIELVPFAARATHFVVSATGATGPTLVVVPASGTRVLPSTSHDPTIEYGVVELDRTPGIMLAAGAAATALRTRARAALRLMAAAEISGAVAAITDLSVEYAKVREQFGRPIGGFQALRHILARMAERSIALESLVDACLDDVDADARLLDELGMVAMAYAAEVGRQVAEDGLQAHGGIGFTAEYPLHLYMRRILTLQGWLGEPGALLHDLGERALAR